MTQPPILSPADYSAQASADALRYVEDVWAGAVPVCEPIRLAVERHIRDCQRAESAAFPYRLDAARSARVFEFFSYLRHWKGAYAGQQFRLLPWQAFCTLSVFGWERLGAEGGRRYRTTYVQVPRKNGKTTWCAGIGLYLFCADGEAGAEVYTAATKRDQARICHRDAIEMRRKSPALSGLIDSFKDNLSLPSNSSKFEPLGANHDSLDGLNVSGAIIDELHRHRDRALWDVIEYGSGARQQPLMWGITTAGDDAQSLAYEMREHALRVLRQAVADETFFTFLAEPDEHDAWDDPATWAKVNPSLGACVSASKMAEDLQKARNMPGAAADFRRYRLDEWITGAREAWTDMEQWNACEPVELALEGRECYGGLDLAATQDVAAFVLYFPACATDPRSHALPFFYVPEDNVVDRGRHWRVPLTEWVEHGWVIATPGNVIDYAYIYESLCSARRLYRIAQIGYDDWNATDIVTRLTEAGASMWPLPQTVKTFSAPMAHLADEIASGVLNHGGNPVLAWMASNVRVASDPSGRIKPMKKEGRGGQKSHKIDGIVALLLAIRRALDAEEEAESVYESQPIMML